MKNKILEVLHNKRLVRYFVMAAIIVSIELVTFQVLILLGTDYLLATALSFVLAVILNWLGGRIFIFGKSRYHPTKEFLMVLVASVVGLVIQMAVVFFSVEVLRFYPFIAKGVSIVFSFFWNYLFRSKLIYKS